jgi:hypothetical protein
MTMEREEFIEATAALIAGMAVPVSLEMKLGAATPAWVQLHHALIGFGWASREEYARAIRKLLADTDPKPPGYRRPRVTAAEKAGGAPASDEERSS